MLRRHLLQGAGSLTASLLLWPGFARAATPVIDITMAGHANGAKVWFNPYGLLVRPGQTLRWTNRDAGNSHTATAYHPDNFDRPRRIPKGAAPFDSGFLLPDESFETTLTEPGIYDYYCIPHEMAGMVGRIVVADPDQDPNGFTPYDAGDLPEAALQALPGVVDIRAKGVLHHEES